MKKCKVFLTSAMLIAAVAGANTVRADDAVVKGATVTIKKTVDLTDDKILMPKTSFNFTVEPDESARGTKDNLDVKPGIPVTGQNLKVDYINGDKPGTKDKTTTVDFANVEFPKAGIYRYIVKETDNKIPGITYDVKEYEVDVYAYDNGNGKIVANYVVSHEKGKEAKEPIQFNNKLKTTSLTVKKTVTGNAGERDREFDFTLELIPNAEFEKGKTVTFTKKGKDNTKTDVVATIGEATTFKLKDGESLTLDKLPVGISYKVDETKVEGYTTSAKLTDGDKAAAAYTLGTEQKSDETADVIDVTNNKEGIIPTGVVNTIAPFAALAIVAIGGSLYFVKRKKA
ncbi:fibronectin-binding protein [Streptococcus dysgalactiae subsp. equisimilis]|uniref:QVPTGV class sortase B protein-sorting domain-containing protein n=1 Tax=Streptococcus dysgalactiae TaxID=1334 RepID=UPI000DA331F5|nr:QVPTGV class sortase B protein-sorting domain-containing protein [Streptococcus dysgalactiae]MBM6539919.1 QVPTGV class sortase B protein-sorting domain-containing protein [Streptococcus dysgalactiae subsp. equisimilis]SQF69797.1 fibronectin-binding protein [Streptococcus dysgalactiae subsp. equisimilis]SQF78930.1 fibronectin-binding protein [Streptococcus dysgalactiae subsp. equisimilis]